jgi:hypothetical protein
MAKKVAARTLDFSNVKESSGVNPKHKEEGEYLARITEVRDDPAKDGEAMWCWIIKPADDASAAYPYYVKLVDNQLWKMRNLFIAAGIPLPKKALKIDPNKVVGKTVGIVLEDDEYEGKMKSVISAVLPKEELSEYAPTEVDEDVEEDEDDEVEEAPVKKSKKAPVVEEDDEEEEEDEEPAPAPKKRGRPKKVVEPEEDEDDEEEDDEPVAPVKRGRGRPKKVVEEEEEEEEEAPAPKKRRAKKVVEDDDDDLDLDL